MAKKVEIKVFVFKHSPASYNSRVRKMELKDGLAVSQHFLTNEGRWEKVAPGGEIPSECVLDTEYTDLGDG